MMSLFVAIVTIVLLVVIVYQIFAKVLGVID